MRHLRGRGVWPGRKLELQALGHGGKTEKNCGGARREWRRGARVAGATRLKKARNGGDVAAREPSAPRSRHPRELGFTARLKGKGGEGEKKNRKR